MRYYILIYRSIIYGFNVYNFIKQKIIIILFIQKTYFFTIVCLPILIIFIQALLL